MNLTRIISLVLFTNIINSHLILANTQSEFYLEKDLVAKIFNETTQENKEKKFDELYILPMIGLLKPNKFTIENKYFSTDYSQISSLPYLYLYGEKVHLSINQSSIIGSISIGYGYLQKNISTSNEQGLSLEDNVSLQWIPIEYTTKYQTTQFQKYGLTPSIDVGLGRIWIHQDGFIDGFDHGTLINYMSLGTSIKILNSENINSLIQISYLSSINKSISNYQTLKLGVGVWLSI